MDQSLRHVLGIDPGSIKTGYGVIAIGRGDPQHIASGVIQTGGGSFAERLLVIFDGIEAVIGTHTATEAAIEEVFVNRNVQSALKLGQARGAAICACARHKLAVHEYTPRLIKQALVGGGGADKQQVSYMVRAILKIQQPLAEDASDALAVALAHVQHDRLRGLLQ